MSASERPPRPDALATLEIILRLLGVAALGVALLAIYYIVFNHALGDQLFFGSVFISASAAELALGGLIYLFAHFHAVLAARAPWEE